MYPNPKPIYYFQANKTTERYEILCKLFILTQCSLSITQSDILNFKERKWEDICLSFTIKPDPLTDPEGVSMKHEGTWR